MAADRQINRFEVLLVGVALGALAVGVPGYVWHNQRIEEERRLAEEAKARALKEQLEDPAQLTRLLLGQAVGRVTPEDVRNLAQLIPGFLPGNAAKGDKGKDDKGKGFDLLRPFLDQALKQDQPKK